MILIGSGLAVINYLVLAYLDVFGPGPTTNRISIDRRGNRSAAVRRAARQREQSRV